jgi:hypothetical protein
MTQASGPIDVHCHWCVFERPDEDLFAKLEALGREGHRAVVIFVMASLGLPRDKTSLLVPDDFHDKVGLRHGRACEQDDLDSWLAFWPEWNSRPRTLEIIPFLDVRAWD